MSLDKCKFNIVEFIYLGHKISVSGIAPDDPRIQKIMEMLEPNDKKKYKDFMDSSILWKSYYQNYQKLQVH